MANPVSILLLVLVTIFIPPVGVFLIAGCGTDILINIILTICGYFPGHIHAFYLIWVYYDRREQSRLGRMTANRAPLVFSENIQRGGTMTTTGPITV